MELSPSGHGRLDRADEGVLLALEGVLGQLHVGENKYIHNIIYVYNIYTITLSCQHRGAGCERTGSRNGEWVSAACVWGFPTQTPFCGESHSTCHTISTIATIHRPGLGTDQPFDNVARPWATTLLRTNWTWGEELTSQNMAPARPSFLMKPPFLAADCGVSPETQVLLDTW